MSLEKEGVGKESELSELGRGGWKQSREAAPGAPEGLPDKVRGEQGSWREHREERGSGSHVRAFSTSVCEFYVSQTVP